MRGKNIYIDLIYIFIRGLIKLIIQARETIIKKKEEQRVGSASRDASEFSSSTSKVSSVYLDFWK